MHQQGVQSRITGENFNCVAGRGVAVKHTLDIFFQPSKHGIRLLIDYEKRYRNEPGQNKAFDVGSTNSVVSLILTLGRFQRLLLSCQYPT